jgi:GDP-L-fucose synthase
MKKDARILIVGHADAIEHSLTAYFRANRYPNVFSTSSLKVDFLDQKSVAKFFETKKPQYVFLGSIRSGGIVANQKFAAEFIYQNLECQSNVIHAAYKSGVKKLLYYTSSCVYPRDARNPIKEESFLTGALEPTSEPYAIAKIAGMKLCETYNRQYGFKAITAVPATVYGPGSDMDLKTAHVIGALIGKFHDAVKMAAKEVTVWGSGKPRREFLYADDFVTGSLFLMDNYSDAAMVNLGCGCDVSIRELAGMIKKISGFKGKIVFDSSKPDGAMRKLLDSKRTAALGWKPRTSLEDGIRRTYLWYSAQGGSR